MGIVNQACTTLTQPVLNAVNIDVVCKDEVLKFVPIVLAGIATVATGLIGRRVYQSFQNPTFLQAAHIGLLKNVQDAIAKKVDLNQQDPVTGDTALHFALVNQHTGVINALLDAGASVTITNQKGETPLHIAFKNKDTAVIRKIISNGANVNAKDAAGNTPLMCAVKKGSLEAVKVLVEAAGIEINAQDLVGKTALALSAREYPNILKVLLQRGADPDLPDSEGQIPLHHAVDQESVEAIEALLEATQDCNRRDKEGKTPLHLTVHHVSSRLSSADALLKCDKIDTSILNKAGESALHEACVRMTANNHLALKFIGSKKFNLDLLTEDGNTAAHIALAHQNYEVLKALHQAGARMDIPNKDGKVVWQGNDDKLAMLYENYTVEQLQDLRIEGLKAIEWATIYCLPSIESVLNKKGIYFTFSKADKERLVTKAMEVMSQKGKEWWERNLPIKIKEFRELWEDIDQLTGPDHHLKQPELFQLCRHYVKSILERRALVAAHKQAGTHLFLSDFLFSSHYEGVWYNAFFIALLPERLRKTLANRTPNLPQLFAQLQDKLPLQVREILEREISLNDLEQFIPLFITGMNAVVPQGVV